MNPSSTDNLLLDFINVDDPSFSPDQSNVSWAFSSSVSPVKVEDDSWNHLLEGGVVPSALVMAVPDDEDIPSLNCIPGGLSRISMTSQSSRSTTPDSSVLMMPGALLQSPPPSVNPATFTPHTADIALNPYSLQLSGFDGNAYSLTPANVLQHLEQIKSEPATATKPSSPSKSSKASAKEQPHPCAISPHSTAALFARASSVSSNSGTISGPPAKKSRAPPSGPISTKDFIPPDVSGLNKREARLVKNRAAAFLSRQRKREEFEGLEARVEVLEADNARLYRELEAYKSGGQPPRATANTASSDAGSSTGALTAEIAGLKRQLASRDVELSNLHTRIRSLVAAQEQFSAERERAAEREQEIAELQRQLAQRNVTKGMVKVEDSDESDAEEQTSAGIGKKDLKSAGSVAAMVLLFSLSTLLTNASKTGGAANPPTASRRPTNMHRRSDSTSSRTFSHFDPTSSTMFDLTNPYAYDSMISGSSSRFGFDEDSLMGADASDPFPTLLSSSSSQQQDVLSKAISGVKSTGPNEFEFDFNVPSSSSSSSFHGKQKKIKVCVKSAVPLDLDLDLGAIKNGLGSTIPSPVKFQPDDLDAPSTAFATASEGLGKRKRPSRVMVEIQPRKNGNVRRKVSDEERWDVSLREEMMEESDEDVLMA